MKIKTFAILFTILIGTHASAETWQPSPGHSQIQIWPGKVPGVQVTDDPEYSKPVLDAPVAGTGWVEVGNVSHPTLTVYSPPAKNTGVSVVVFPGGGYQILAIDLEGTEVCDWLTAKGITCILLKYRVPNSGPHWDEKLGRQMDAKAPMALQDAQRAVGLVRFHAKEWKIDPHKIGVLGFSAGGHLVADISTHFKKRLYPEVDEADQVSCRPDFVVALYPGHMLEHTTKPFEMNPTVPVTQDVPPTFIVQAEDDPVDTVENSLRYYIALWKAGVPTELHLYANGKHAFGLRPTQHAITKWPKLVETWLKTLGMQTN